MVSRVNRETAVAIGKWSVYAGSYILAIVGMVQVVYCIVAGIQQALMQAGFYVGVAGTIFAASSLLPVASVVSTAVAPLGFAEFASVCNLLTGCTLAMRKASR